MGNQVHFGKQVERVRSSGRPEGGFFDDGGTDPAVEWEDRYLCRVLITSRHTGNHQRAGPKLPYQAVVMRQSARLQKGSNCHSAEKAVSILTVERSVWDRGRSIRF